MTKEELKRFFRENSFREASKDTYPNTYTIVPERSLLTEQVDNRDSRTWTKAEYIVLENYSGNPAQIVENWKKLTAKDTLPGKIQKMCIPVDQNRYEIYDARGNQIYCGELRGFFEKNSLAGYGQIIYYGAPGTGKSYKVNLKLNTKLLLEKKFKSFLEADRSLNDGSVSDYCSYYRNLEAGTRKSLFDYTNSFLISKWQQEFQYIWDTHWTSVLNKYIAFLKTRPFTGFYRTTFHPDYDYAQFVGVYKPNEGANGITYSFVPQVFALAYAKAWHLLLNNVGDEQDKQVYLVIEEINRGNCAQIFGDLFQLLDREKNGFSQYSIDADHDFAVWLQTKSELSGRWSSYEDAVGAGKLMLPPNLNILATMNTSDQSLFPMDSAFKRRFDWEYVAIDYAHPNADFDIEVGDKKYKWLDFLEKVNKNVFKVTKSEDKQMGEFFIKHSVDYKEFRSKVLFYLWDSVYKDEEGNKDAERVFHFKLEGNQDKTLTFQTLFEGSEVDQKDRIAKIMSNLDVVDQNAPPPPQQGEQGANAAAAEPAPAEEPDPAQ